MKDKSVKNKRRLWRIFGITAGAFLMVVIMGVVFLYLSIESISLDDIEARRHLIETTGEGEDALLPGVLEGAVDKAEGLSNKPINRQDALDVAAILLNSGLSYREMYVLLGQSTEELTTEEKQHIRDLLLAKLKPEEIAALRSITKEYGKGLLILDPDYPIELIGVEDKQERERIKKELEKSDKLASQKENNKQSAGTSGTDKHSGERPEIENKKSETKESTVTSSADKSGENTAFKAKYEKQLSSIQSTCTSTAEDLINKAVKEVSQLDNKSTASALKVLQAKLLGDIAASEQNCDSKFQAVVEQAEAEGLSKATIAAWEKTYNGVKQNLRQRALTQIQKSLK